MSNNNQQAEYFTKAPFTVDDPANAHMNGVQGLQVAVLVNNALEAKRKRDAKQDTGINFAVLADILFPEVDGRLPRDAALETWLLDHGDSYGSALGSMNGRGINLNSMYSANRDSGGGYLKFSDTALTGSAEFQAALKVTLEFEGGYNPNEPDGQIAIFGINSKYHPEVRNGNFTLDKAIAKYEDGYWNKINGIESLDKATAIAVFDAAVNCGPGRANQWLAASTSAPPVSEVSLDKFFELRREHYDRLIRNNPAKYARYENGWENRVAKLERTIANLPREDADDSQQKMTFNDASRGTLGLASDPDAVNELLTVPTLSHLPNSL